MAEMNGREDEINLYDYWKVIVRRKRLIIGLFLVAILVSAVISLLMPKIYRGEVTLKLPAITAKELIAKELLGVIGKLDAEKIKSILPKTHHLIADVKLNALKDSTDKLQLIIEAKNTDALPQAATEFVEYLNDIPLIKEPVEREKREKEKVARAKAREKEKVAKRLKDIPRLIKNKSDLIKEYNSFAKMYDRKLERGELSIINLVPADFKQRAMDLDNERRSLVEEAKEYKEAKEEMENITGVLLAGNPYISRNPVKPTIKKNITIAGITSLFSGIFLAFFLEYIKKLKR